VKKDSKIKAAAPSPAAAPAAATPASDLGPDPCFGLDKLAGDPPVYLAGKGVVLTRLAKPCSTRDGKRGVEKGSPFLAMGFPCTGGAGRVDIKGNYNSPKMVSFILGTDCGMNPAAMPAAAKTVAETVGLPADSKLLAYTPFVVQFWELPGMPDADTGFSVDVRSAPALEALWAKFKNKEPIRVRLFGRENTWGQGDHFYFVEADLRQAGRTAFQLDVVAVKPLKREEVEEVKVRCEALRPKRNCLEVF